MGERKRGFLKNVTRENRRRERKRKRGEERGGMKERGGRVY